MVGLNPICFSVWGVVDKDTNCCASNTKAQLIDTIKINFEVLPREIVASACSRFRTWIEAVIDTNSSYFDSSVIFVSVYFFNSLILLITKNLFFFLTKLFKLF